MAVQPPDPPDPKVVLPKSYASLFSAPVSLPSIVSCSSSPLEYFKGCPAVFFSKEEIEVLARPYKSALVGKLKGYRPLMPELRRRMDTIGFKGAYTVGLLDPKHVIIQFVNEEDYQRCWLKREWNLGTSLMKITPWMPNWSPEAEPPIAPVWIEFRGLPIHFFGKSTLQRISSHLGTMIKVDAATERRTRPSVAKVSIAMNLLKTPPDHIWIGTDVEEGFWQEVTYLDLPNYCTRCSKIGHSTSACEKGKAKLKNPIVQTLTVWREVARKEGLGKTNSQKEMVEKQQTSSEMVTTQAKQKEINDGSNDNEENHHNLFCHEVHRPAANEQEIPAAIQDDIEEINEEYQTGQPSFPYPEEQNSERIQEHAKNGASPTHTTVQNQMQVEERCSTPIQLSPIQETNNNGTGVEERCSTVQPSPMLPSQGVGPTGEQINNVLLTTPTIFFGPNNENSAAELLQHYMTEQQKQKENACLTLKEAEEDARPTEEEMDNQVVDQHLDNGYRDAEPNVDKFYENKVQENPHPTAEEVASPTEEETNTVTVADMRTVAAHAVTVADGNCSPCSHCSSHEGTVAITVANNLTIPHVQVQFMDAIDNHIVSERAQEIQMEALDLAEPRQKITKGHMELRKLDINATRMNELLHMDKMGTGVASRLRSKHQRPVMDSIETPLEYIEEITQSKHMDDTDEDTEEIDYMDEVAQQWEVNIGSSRRRALQTRRKANKIAVRGNTLISRGKCHAYEVKRRGGFKF